MPRTPPGLSHRACGYPAKLSAFENWAAVGRLPGMGCWICVMRRASICPDAGVDPGAPDAKRRWLVFITSLAASVSARSIQRTDHTLRRRFNITLRVDRTNQSVARILATVLLLRRSAAQYSFSDNRRNEIAVDGQALIGNGRHAGPMRYDDQDRLRQTTPRR